MTTSTFTQHCRLPTSATPVLEAVGAWYQRQLRRAHAIIDQHERAAVPVQPSKVTAVSNCGASVNTGRSFVDWTSLRAGKDAPTDTSARRYGAIPHLGRFLVDWFSRNAGGKGDHDQQKTSPSAIRADAIRIARQQLDMPSWFKESLLIDLGGQRASRRECWILNKEGLDASIAAMKAAQDQRRSTLMRLLSRAEKDRKDLIAAHRKGRSTRRSQVALGRESGLRQEIHELKATIHQKERRLRAKEDRRRALDAGPSLVFGGRRLFHAQHDLQANHYADHDAWRSDWRSARSGGFLIVGRKREPHGNQHAQITLLGKAGDEATAGTTHLLTLTLPAVPGLAASTLALPITLRDPAAILERAVTTRPER